MSREINEYADDAELVLFYQLLGVSPQLGAVMYRPELDEAFRAWLEDRFDAAPVQEQNWLTVLFLYYGIYDGVPKQYTDVALIRDSSKETVREQAARGLRYLWDRTHRPYADAESGLREALAVNEWPVADLSQEVSLDFFMVLMDQAGLFANGVGPGDAARREPDLWNPEYAEKIWPELTQPDRIIMKDGVFSTG